MPKDKVVYLKRELSHADRARIRALHRTGSYSIKQLESIFRCNYRAVERALTNNLKGKHKGDLTKDHEFLGAEFLRVMVTHELDAVRAYIDRSRNISEPAGGTPPVETSLDDYSDFGSPLTWISSRESSEAPDVPPLYLDEANDVSPAPPVASEAEPRLGEACGSNPPAVQPIKVRKLRLIYRPPPPDSVLEEEVPIQTPSLSPDPGPSQGRATSSATPPSTVKAEDEEDDEIQEIFPKAETPAPPPAPSEAPIPPPPPPPPPSDDPIHDFLSSINPPLTKYISAVEEVGIRTQEHLRAMRTVTDHAYRELRRELERITGMSFVESLLIVDRLRTYEA